VKRPLPFAYGLVAVLSVAAPHAAAAQVRDIRAALDSLRAAPVSFRPPEAEVHEVLGVPVLFLEDRSVPLVDVMARFKGGYGLFSRDRYAAGTALPALLRYGGTSVLPPDSVDRLLEHYALQTSFGGGGESIFSSLNTLSEHLTTALDLWGSMLRSPGFDPHEVEVWRLRELDAVRRRPDDPQIVAFSEFNRLLFGDHPVGWEMSADDLRPELLVGDELRALHRRILCIDNLILGVTGDVSWPEAEAQLKRMLSAWPRCDQPLPEGPDPDIREGGGVFVIPRDLEQSVLVMAHPTDVHLGDPDYFSAQIGNTILGAGGFSSRLLSRVRTEEGYAYSASSLWTMPRRVRGLLGAVTRTRPENAAPALQLILEILSGMRDQEPTGEEVGTAVDQVVNGFVFNFETASQIVSRRMSFLALDLPVDWLEQYLEGVQEVTPASVRRVFRQHLHPDRMTILVVGDPERMGLEALRAIGPVTVLTPPGGD
jgi:predicted Zn-dependent peptidase